MDATDLFAGTLGTAFTGPLLNLALPPNGAPLAIAIPDLTNPGNENCKMIGLLLLLWQPKAVHFFISYLKMAFCLFLGCYSF